MKVADVTALLISGATLVGLIVHCLVDKARFKNLGVKVDTATAVTGGKNGTKWLGAIGAVAGTVAAVNPALLPPSWLPYYLIVSSLLTVARGFVNTKNINAGTTP